MKRRIILIFTALAVATSALGAVLTPASKVKAADTSVTYTWKSSTEIDASGSAQFAKNDGSPVALKPNGSGTSGGTNYQAIFWYKPLGCYVEANLVNVNLGDTTATVQVTQHDVAETALISPPACNLKQIQNAFNGTVQLANAGAVKAQPPTSNKTVDVEYYLPNSPYTITCNSQGTGDTSQVTPKTATINVTGPNGYNQTQTVGPETNCDAKAPYWGYTFKNAGAGNYTACVQAQGISQTCQTGTLNAQDTNVDIAFNQPQPPGSNATTPSCESQGGPFSWLLCTGAEYMADAEQSIENIISGLLVTQPINFSASSNCVNGYSDAAKTKPCNSEDQYSAKIYNVWSNFRTIGDIVLVIALLVIVFGEVIGGGVVDAYTAKKILPRILVAAILINLSIYFVTILEDIFNVIGGGIETLIEAPFNLGNTAMGITKTFAIHIQGGAGLAGFFIAGAAISYAGFSLGIGMLLLVVIGFALIAALGVLVTIMARVFILVFLVLLSPVAFALYCLPNTEQYFKKWWQLLIKTLMVYPIIGVVFAASNVAGTIFSNFNLDVHPQFLAQLFAVATLIVPLFLVPFAFRMSGGLLGNIAGMVSNLSKTARTPLSNLAKKQAGKRVAEFRRNGLYANDGKLRHRFGNAMGGWMFNADEKLPYKVGNSTIGKRTGLMRGTSQRLGTQIQQAKMEESQKLFEEMNNVEFANDKSFAVIGGMHSELSDGTKQKLAQAGLLGKELKTQKDFETAAHILEQSSEHTERIGGQAVERMGGLILNKQHLGMGYANSTAASMMGYSAHGFMTEDALVDGANHLADSDGMHFADAMAVKSELYGRTAGLKAGYSHAVVKDPTTGKQRIVSAMDPIAARGGRDWELVGSMTTDDIAGMKSGRARKVLGVAEEIIGTSRALQQNPADEAQLRATWAGQGLSQGAIDSRLRNIHEKADSLEATISQLSGDFSRAPADTAAAAEVLAQRLGIQRGRGFNPNAQAQGGGPAPGAGAGPNLPQPPQGGPPNPAGPGGSDARLKKNMRLIGKKNGINLYSFQYVWGDQYYVGVIAQEVIKIHPEAVLIDDYGFYMVDYGKLGLRMRLLEDWLAEQEKVSSFK